MAESLKLERQLVIELLEALCMVAQLARRNSRDQGQIMFLRLTTSRGLPLFGGTLLVVRVHSDLRSGILQPSQIVRKLLPNLLIKSPN